MTMQARIIFLVSLAFGTCLGTVRSLTAEVYPSRPVTIINPFPAGAPLDTVARVVGERMRVSLGAPIMVENVTGAAGTIGVGRVARAAADGYTLGIGNLSSHIFAGATHSLQYDLMKEFRTRIACQQSPANYL
jgi:tripartite-type tricarboxylate transporter receptor subunit TctC